MIGAILNVILNLLLIPRFEVFGATIATLVSYFVIYIQRALDIKKNIDINIHLFKNIASILILIMQSLIYCSSVTTAFIRYSVCILSCYQPNKMSRKRIPGCLRLLQLAVRERTSRLNKNHLQIILLPITVHMSLCMP